MQKFSSPAYSRDPWELTQNDPQDDGGGIESMGFHQIPQDPKGQGKRDGGSHGRRQPGKDAANFIFMVFPLPFRCKSPLSVFRDSLKYRKANGESQGKYPLSCNPSVTGGPGAGFVVAWGFGRYAPEASAGMGRDSKKALNLCKKRREALAPAPSTKKSPPHGSKRTVRTPRPWHLFALTPDLNP